MHTNVWLTLKWHDFQMRWNPVKYGEIRQIRVQPDKVWLPDIVLFNKYVVVNDQRTASNHEFY
ncbi:hypothetical protein COOONC_13966 [Cooperia oncophora]